MLFNIQILVLVFTPKTTAAICCMQTSSFMRLSHALRHIISNGKEAKVSHMGGLGSLVCSPPTSCVCHGAFYRRHHSSTNKPLYHTGNHQQSPKIVTLERAPMSEPQGLKPNDQFCDQYHQRPALSRLDSAIEAAAGCHLPNLGDMTRYSTLVLINRTLVRKEELGMRMSGPGLEPGLEVEQHKSRDS